MGSFFYGLRVFLNEVFLSAMAAVFVSQVIKIWFYMHKNGLSLNNLVFAFLSMGGMPSSHSAVVSALSLSVYFSEKWTTITFVVLFLSFIVIRDALGVRKEVEKQTSAIKAIMKKTGLNPDKYKLSTRVGHSYAEVAFGVMLGLVIAVAVHMLFV